MFQSAAYELARLQHGHGNNEWHDMYEVSSEASPGHDSAGSDPEREWSNGKIYRCSVCEDEIRVVYDDERKPPNP